MPVQKDVVIAMPAYDGKTEFAIHRAINESISDPECPVSNIIEYSGDSLVTRARNECVFLFEQMPVTNAKYLIFIDSDIYFRPDDITRLRSHNLPVVAGLYFIKNMNCLPVLNTPIGTPIGDLQRVREIGTGFLMIRRDVFAGLRAMEIAKTYKAADNQPQKDKRRTEFFPVGVLDDQLQSEDYYFCRMCEQINVHTYADTKVILGHKSGNMLYPMRPHQLAPALEKALRSFRSLPEDQTVTQDMIQSILDAYAVHANLNAKPDVKPLNPIEHEFEVTYKSPDTTTPEPQLDARGGA